jgi:hypothetical protein
MIELKRIFSMWVSEWTEVIKGLSKLGAATAAGLHA